MCPGHMQNDLCWSATRLVVRTIVPLAATAGATGYCVPQVVSFGTLRCNSLRAPHLTRLETRTKESDMRASRWVLNPGMHKEAIEWEFLTGRTAGRPGSSVKGLSWSMPVRTRKMVKFSQAG
jgi:hypothetical protein